jgi:hypothetical protein
MRLRLQRKGWSEERISAVMPSWGLGASGLGLLTGFAHGIPKPVVTLFWLGGKIRVHVLNASQDYRFEGMWTPLFSRRVAAP